MSYYDYYTYNYPLELYHHGIKGMKWGVRRFQKKDGTLTDAGKKRYSDDGKTTSKSKSSKTSTKIKLTQRDVYEKKYRDAGMTAEEAKAAAKKRDMVNKVILGMAGVTVAACAAYYAKNKWTATYCDQILKSGTKFHNLDAFANARPGEHLYVNYRQNDVNYFRGHFALGKLRKSGHVYNHVLTAESDVKIPGLNTRKSVFKQLYDSDPDFRRVFNEHARVGKGDRNFSANKVYKKMWPKFGDKNDPEFNIAKRKYFDALKQKGYDAVVDEYDSRKGVFRADAPLILLDTSSKSFGSMSIKELSARDILLAQANARYYRDYRDILNAMGTPHANNFKENSKQLARYAKKSAQNEAYINKAIEALNQERLNKGLKVMDENRNVLARQGAKFRDVGMILDKNKKLSVIQAYKIANAKEAVENNAKQYALSSIMVAPLAGISVYRRNKHVREYIEEHPNTKLTYNQLVKKYNEGTL